jgi:DNA-binding FadR family transcriptional regulator
MHGKNLGTVRILISRAAVLADHIEGAIADGAIPTGSRLGTKEELRQTYDVAYGTLNEALRMLQQRGYVTSRTGPGGGLFASAPTANLRLCQLILGFREGGTLADCAIVRHALEEPVTLDAARSCTHTDITDLEEIMTRMTAARNDARAYLYENWQLHRRIALICSNRILGNLYNTLLDASESELQDVFPHPSFVATVDDNLAAHRAIVDAIAARSDDRVRAAIRSHEAFFVVTNGDRPLLPPPSPTIRRG